MITTLRTVEQIELEALRDEVRARLAECTEKQQAFFAKVYPGGIDSLDRDKLRNAVGLCQRTVAKNGASSSQRDGAME